MCDGVKRDSEKAITQIVLRALAQRSSPSNSSHFLEGQQAIKGYLAKKSAENCFPLKCGHRL